MVHTGNSRLVIDGVALGARFNVSHAPETLELNAIGDGRNMVISPHTNSFDAQLRERGYDPVPVDVSKLHLGGGGIKCCTLELRGARP